MLYGCGKKTISDNILDNVKIEDNVKIITPGLNRVLGNPYKVEVTRYIPYES